MAARPPDQPPSVADRAEVRRLLLAFGVGCFASALGTRLLDPLMPQVGVEFLTDPRTTALLATAFALPYALIQPILGPIGDALGKRRVIGWCLLALAAATMLCALAPGFWSLFAARILAGAAAGGVFPLTLAVFGDRVPLGQRQVAISRLLMFAILGQISGGLLAATLGPLAGWRGVMMVAAVASVIGWAAMRGGPRVAAQPLRFGQAFAQTGQILGNPAARLLFGAVFAEGCLIFGMFPYLAPIMVERGIGGTVEAGIAIAAFGCGGFLYTLLAAPGLRAIGQSGLLLLGAGLIAGALLAVGLAQASVVVIAAAVALGLGFFAVHGSIQTRVTEVAPHARGSAVSMHAFWFFLGQSLGPAAFGLAAGGVGVLATLTVCAAGILVLGVLLARR
ncbi:MFS transporter [Humitalea sp. 24SJ18S-53]|uniref:MFS transporter n=1 Tax=Humitalea sp. 24SJ18S-53 TaxID=3422307 RepID=UPI003D66F4E1